MGISREQAAQLREDFMDDNGMSWTITGIQRIGMLEPDVTKGDVAILREHAKKVAEIASSPEEDRKRKLWSSHNSLEETVPLVFCDPEMAWYELISPAELKCVSKLAKAYEYRLLKEIYWAKNIRDDRVVRSEFPVHYLFSETGRGVETIFKNDLKHGSMKWEAPLRDYNLLSILTPKRFIVDYNKTERFLETAQMIFDGILDVRLESSWWWSWGLTMDMVYLRGLEQFYYDMYEHENELHALMAFLRDEAMGKLDFLEQNGLLSLNNTGDFIGTGGYGWCDELPAAGFDPSHVRTSDMWGYAESQETTGVSPEFFREFVFDYQLPILNRFGLNIYGCCEPLETRWQVVREVPRLRRVTVSPWSDPDVMAEALGKDYVYCGKVNPAYMAGENMIEDAARREIRNSFMASKKNGCPCEIMLRDVLTLSGNADNAINWVKIAREEAAAIYG